MDPSQHPDDLVAPLRDDVVSGASAVSRQAADILARAAGTVHADSAAEVRSALAHVAVRILDAQPAMAPLVALVSAVLEAAAGQEDTASARRAARAAARDFADAAPVRTAEVAQRTAALLSPGATVLTFSASSTVLGALRAAPALARVIVLESRPVREGRETARALADAGVPVLFAVDAAAAALVRRCDAVVVGADSIGDAGWVNKVGSLPLALAAREAGVPVMVAADHTKILPVGFPQPLDDDRPPAQVWQPPRGVQVWNRYFEAVPLALADHLATDRGRRVPGEMDALRAGIRVPEEIAAWGRKRRAQDPQDPPS